MVGVKQWADIRRLHFVKGLSQREIRRRAGLHRDTIRRAINSSAPPVYRRAPAGSKLDAFKDEICRLRRDDPKLPASGSVSCSSRSHARSAAPTPRRNATETPTQGAQTQS